MRVVEITRSRNTQQGIVGIIAIDNVPFCVCLEQPWNNNKAFASCVPAGFYHAKRIESPRYGWTFEIQNVPNGRVHCVFHWGNDVDDTRGCVLTARYIGKLKGKLAILYSRKTFDAFMDKFIGEEIIGLIITNPALS